MRAAALGAAAVVLGGLAFWMQQQAGDLRSAPAARDTALADGPRTSEVKGAVTAAVNRLFSYDFADFATSDAAARELLTGRAVGEYAALFAPIRRDAPAQRLVLTTTVTDGAVRSLQGNRARVLVFADQRGTSTASGGTSAGTAMLAVDAVRQGGTWRISHIDTLATG